MNDNVLEPYYECTYQAKGKCHLRRWCRTWLCFICSKKALIPRKPCERTKEEWKELYNNNICKTPHYKVSLPCQLYSPVPLSPVVVSFENLSTVFYITNWILHYLANYLPILYTISLLLTHFMLWWECQEELSCLQF